MKKLLIVLAVFASASFGVIALGGGSVFAQLDAGINATCPGGTCPGGANPEAKVNEIVTLVINLFSWFVGVLSVIMIMVGGFKYVTAGGDTGKVGSAKNTILYAIIGLVIVALAQVIVRVVLGLVT